MRYYHMFIYVGWEITSYNTVISIFNTARDGSFYSYHERHCRITVAVRCSSTLAAVVYRWLIFFHTKKNVFTVDVVCDGGVLPRSFIQDSLIINRLLTRNYIFKSIF
jgi:hypothetical protein